MKDGARGALALVVAVVMLTAVCAQAQVRQGPSGRMVARGLNPTMAGELEAVDGSGAWGRLVVEDLEGEALVSVEGEVFDLEPLQPYSLTLDGIHALDLQTDEYGDAVLSGVMTSDSSLNGSYGAAMVPGVSTAGNLWYAVVLDQDMNGVLEGRLSPAAGGGSGGLAIMYQERISLQGPDGTGSVGMARVERRASGAQLFETAMTGLPANESFEVIVDGILAATVQADSLGEASVRLKAPDGGGPDNALPAALQPVDDLRSVQWVDAGGSLVASGTFSGLGTSSVNLLGTVQMVGDSSFVVVPLDQSPEVTVLVGDATRWGGELSGIDDLEPDLLVLVRGDLQPDGSLLAWLVAGGQDVPPDLVVLNGVVGSVGDSGFVLELNDGTAPVTVQVDDETRWRGDLTGLGDLAAGDAVHVTGEPLDNGEILARCVAGFDEPPVPPVLVTGLVESIGLDSFVLIPDGDPQALTVKVGDETRWLGSLDGIDDLEPDMPVLVQGEMVDGELVADMVADHEQPPLPVSVFGTVDSVGAESFMVIDDQGASVEIEVDDETHWAGAARSLDDLEPGMWVHVEGELEDDGSVEAWHVMVRTEPPAHHVTLVGVVETVGDSSFDLLTDPVLGTATTIQIVVDDQTDWADPLTGLGDLVPGMMVLVEGELQADGTVQALLVVGEPDPPNLVTVSGVVDSVGATGFVVLDQHLPVEVVVDDETFWAGALSGLDDVEPGMRVHVEGELQDDGTVLARFVGSRPDLPDPVILIGSVSSIGPNGFVVDEQGELVDVVVDDATIWADPLTGLADLVVGMQIMVHGEEQDDDTVLAHLVATEPEPPDVVTVSGVVDSVSATGFVVVHQNLPVEIVVDDDTFWTGALSGLDDVEPGMRVHVEGEQQNDGTVLAFLVGSRPDIPTPVVLLGEVDSSNASGFVVSGQGMLVEVVVDDDTAWGGSLTGLADVEVGMQVLVHGEELNDGTVLAHMVAGEPDQPRPVTLVGQVDSVSAIGFVLSNPAGVVTIEVDDDTIWGGSLTGLADVQVGMQVLVEGILQDNGTVLANLVAGEPSLPPPVTLTGVVESVGSTGFVLHDHGAVVQVSVDPSTVWGGALSGLGDLVPGMRVLVEGERQGDGSVLALFVAGEPNQPVLITVSGPVDSVLADGFVVLDRGAAIRIVVGDHTMWIGAADDLDDLEPGMHVMVEGEQQPSGAVDAFVVHSSPAGG